MVHEMIELGSGICSEKRAAITFIVKNFRVKPETFASFCQHIVSLS